MSLVRGFTLRGTRSHSYGLQLYKPRGRWGLFWALTGGAATEGPVLTDFKDGAEGPERVAPF